MPVTRSEMLFFTAGVVAGAVGHATYPRLREKLAPLLDAALAGVGDGHGAVIQDLAERFDRAREAARSATHPAQERPAPHTVVS